MIRYEISCPHPSSHFVIIDVFLEQLEANQPVIFKLPMWRPGRYELQNYPKNIRTIKAFDIDGEELLLYKIDIATWQIETKGNCELRISYEYYAKQLDAGASYVNLDFWYINPCNCLIYTDAALNEPCEMFIHAPETYRIACSLPKIQSNLYAAENYHILADSPFIASPTIQHSSFEIENCMIHLWFQGEFLYDEVQLIEDTKAYCLEQIKLFGDIECSEYHFMYHMLPYAFHHGVEHLNNTVIAMGPDKNFERRAYYTEFLGVSSHEFFHLWNVKRIRPTDMLPYRYDQENYSTLGWVYEGFTTYYGDLICLRSGLYSFEEWANTFNKHLARHFNNAGRYYNSVASSSYDTWLDGYQQIVPERKVNIYTEGLLAAFILDMSLREETNNKKNLDDVMRLLYHQYYKKGLGYTEQTIQELCEELTQKDYTWFFSEIINGCGYIEQYLPDAVALAGLELIETPSENSVERVFGFRFQVNNNVWKIISIWPSSPAFEAGLDIDDQIISIHHKPVQLFSDVNTVPILGNLIIEVENLGKVRTLELIPNGIDYYNIYTLGIIDSNQMNEMLDVKKS